MSDEIIDKQIEELEADITISDGIGKSMSDSLGKLSDEEKNMIKDTRKAGERDLTNKHAYALLQKSEQGYANFYEIQMEIEKVLVNIYDTHNILMENQIDITKGRTEQKDRNGKEKTIDTLKVEVMNGKYLIRKNIGILRKLCSNLYNYVGTHILNSKEVIIDENGYNEQIDKIISALKDINFELY